jgi:hypothetical protein
LQMPKRAARIGRWSAGGFELPLDASADLLLGTNNPPDAPAESRVQVSFSCVCAHGLSTSFSDQRAKRHEGAKAVGSDEFLWDLAETQEPSPVGGQPGAN